MDELLLVLLALMVLVPIAALVVAIAASQRASALDRGLKAIAGRLEVALRRLRDLERASGAPVEAPAEEAVSGSASAPGQPPPAAPSPPVPEPPPARFAPPPPRPSRASGPSPRPERPSRPPFELEKLLGGSLLIWVGGVALALAGAFLVKYSFEQGWISPAVRIALGLAFGIVLVGLGEWMRSRSRRIGQALCAAGLVSIFAALLAGTNLYELLHPAVGLAGLALTAGAAVLLSLRHGAFVAGLGLVGGFLTPALIRIGEPRPALLFAYLFLLQLALLFVSRQRRWRLIFVLSALGGYCWVIGRLIELGPRPPEPWLGLFVLASTAATVLAVVGGFSGGLSGDGSEAAGPASGGGLTIDRLLGLAAAGIGLLLSGLLLQAADFSWLEWSFVLILATACAVLARLDERYHLLAWIAAGALLVMLLAWSLSGVGAARAGGFAVVVLAGLSIFGLGAAWAARGAARPAAWSALSAAATIAYLLAAVSAFDEPPGPLPWWCLGLLLAGAHALALLLLLPQRSGAQAGDRETGEDAAAARSATSLERQLAAHAVGATVLVSLAVSLELSRPWLAVAWALELPALAFIERRLRLPILRLLAAGLAVLVLMRQLLDPGILDRPLGELWIFDWLLYGYGVPVAAFALAAVIFRKRADDALVAGLEAGSALLAFAWIFLELRHVFHGDALAAFELRFLEGGLLCSAWLLLAGALLWLGKRHARPALAWSGRACTLIALATGLFFPGLVANPLWRHFEVAGPRVFNVLLASHGLPALLAALLAGGLRLAGERALAKAAAVASLVLSFLLVTLEVRHWFAAPWLDVGQASSRELYAYSAAWVLLGVATLLLGLRLKSQALRHGALAVMLAAVAKVFLYDTRELQDLWRVLSFFGLGVSLLALGYIYQRFVLRVEPGSKDS